MPISFIVGVLLLCLVACSPAQGSGPTSPLPPGDVSRGAVLFTQSISGAPACITCHSLDGSALVGPSMQGLGQTASTRVDGLSAEAYLHQSITQAPAYIVPGYGNLMYNQYAQRLSAQQIADLVAYLLTL